MYFISYSTAKKSVTAILSGSVQIAHVSNGEFQRKQPSMFAVAGWMLLMTAVLVVWLRRRQIAVG